MPIYIPPSSSASGVANNFGLLGNGTTDNSAALNAFQAYAKAQSTAGNAVTLVVQPGTYNFDHSLCQGFLYNIKRLRIIGYGAIFQNTYNQSISGTNFGYELPWPSAASGNLRTDVGNGKLINTTAIGDSSVTLVTPADSSIFTVGTYALVSSLDIQLYGYPPNPDQFDFVKITAINAGTGVITFANDKLKYNHRSDFPDGVNSVQVGKARIFDLNTFYLQPTPLNSCTWDVDHVYEGIEVRQAPTSALTYFSIIGRRNRFQNCTLTGISPTVAGIVEIDGCRITTASEPDKIVSSLSITNCPEIAGPFPFQSSSIDQVSIINSRFRGQLSAGSAKYFYAHNVEADEFDEAPTFGLNRTTIISACRFASGMVPYINALGGVEATIDGVNSTYSNGTFRILKTWGAGVGSWTVLPGATINLAATGGLGHFYSGDAGNGIVTRVYEDATYTYIETTLPYVTLPAWTFGTAFVQRSGRFYSYGSTGCDNVRNASEATAQGKQPWELFRAVWAGKSAQTGYFQAIVGNLTRFRVNVIKATAIAGATLTFSKLSVKLAADFTDPRDVALVFDLTVAGVRDFNQTALIGKTTNDSVKLATVAQTFLPVGRWWENYSVDWSFNYNPASSSPQLLPVVEVQMEVDTGLYRRVLTIGADTTAHVIAAVTGTLP